jgi:hypothetical protein
VLLHPEKNIRQSMMTQSKYQNSLKTNLNNSNPAASKPSKLNENGKIENRFDVVDETFTLICLKLVFVLKLLYPTD